MQSTIGLSASCESVLQGEPFKVRVAQFNPQVLDVSNQLNLSGFPGGTWNQQKPLPVMLHEHSGVEFPKSLATEMKQCHRLANVHEQPRLVQQIKQDANKLQVVPEILLAVDFTLQ